MIFKHLMMEFTKPSSLFLITVFLGFLLFPAGNAFSQNHGPDDVLNYGNVLIMCEDHFKDGNISQKGFFNHMYIWQSQDSLLYCNSKIEGSQNGILNQTIIYSQQNATPFNTKVDQQGIQNRLTFLQVADKNNISKKDSTCSKKNSVTISQKGNGNRATVIQN